MRPIIFFGTEEFSAVSLQKLIDENFPVAGIITKPDSRRGRGQKFHAPTVKKIGEAHNIPVFQPQKMSETVDFIQQFERPVGVLVSFGRIIPQNIINLFEPAIINVHPSLLPKYRGASPIETAILNGDEKTGVSLMRLAKEMDAGDIYSQEEFPLSSDMTASQLYAKTAVLGAEMLVRDLADIISGKIAPQPQNHAQATFSRLLNKTDSLLQPEEQTARQAIQQIHAFEIFPKSKIQVGENLIIVNSAKIAEQNSENSPLKIQFKDGKFLEITSLIAPSGKQMTAESFINGYLKTKK